ncbi:MAG: O-antigen ligase family protein, partial [Patescibacteria group bacterium]|nr:O-antigen ligase family protein [Patescibacteria group bacterium]
SFLLIIFNLWVMLSAASRGVMLAFGISLFSFFLFLIFTSKSRLLKVGIIILLILILSGLIFIQLPQFSSQINKMPIFVRRLANFTVSAADRFDAWLIGLKGFIDRPLSGWGWENYNLIFNKYYQPRYLVKGIDATWFDRSHNQVIDVLALSGPFGLVSYLSIFGAIFWLIYKKTKRGDTSKKNISLVILGLMFLAYFIQNLFVFDTPAPLIIFYFSLGLVYFIASDTWRSNLPTDLPKEVRPRAGSRFPLPVLVLLVVVISPAMMYKFNFEPFQQSRLGAKAWNAAKVDFNTALYWYQKALSKPCFTNLDTRVYLAQMIAQGHNDIGEKTTQDDLQILGLGTELAISEYKKNTQEHPWDARYWLYLGQLYGLGVKYDRSYIAEAKRVLNKALSLSPNRQQVYFELARIYYYEKEYAKAITLLERTVVLSPEVRESIQKLKNMVAVAEKEKPDLEELAKAKKFLEYLAK